ncbi:glutamine--fructose-6-phosphate transaminase (isomerizing) [Roseospira marina]|uniref:Glutamine--fructose-6-phosphate aminotransferase [isomerizing] n=1 Tax=Roseospira marina TaxID=140057 RepID=A0A5M6IGR0_9PROT|nr:glutamine--fructose-6-phosphate transaminase (isomerizing) [Roseospira marina]KAA5607342.1 glutamine--fructose-6-phosphate transaminase (isomerizing) [Roseospira marina]MBB4312494.1 glucosamine--fructose-6-phosphate aminotransferase (isomerizing) [Roseospira marina]MBB5085490.1 glucosamine--fructose-6-phosphate aminotransferase (isomerizing) [Roseospira marina]
MCGIVGIIGTAPAASRLIEGLRRLEYRGYDSAGLATLDGGAIQRRRAKGKIAVLDDLLRTDPIGGTTGVGHTRWATHGMPNEANAHPHANGRVAVVHNGIIENFQTLRDELVAKGHAFTSDTDTEVVVHLISQGIAEGTEPIEATRRALGRLEGAFALGILLKDRPDVLIAARQGSPLALGRGEGEMFLGSDALALAPMTQRITYLEDGDWAVLTTEGATIRDLDGQEVARPEQLSSLSGAMIGKGGHRHFMAKEIFEQPQVIGDTLNAMFNPTRRSITLPDLPFDLAAVPRITMIACGTASLAGLVGKYWLERFAGVAVDWDLASEFRYRAPVMAEGGLAIFISQSGETADTLAALRYCKQHGQHCLGIVNAPESTIAREADAVLPTLAGPEIGVASTKAFTTQLVVLACLTIALARARGVMDRETEARLSGAMTEVPSRAAEVLNHDGRIRAIAEDAFVPARDVLYLGRGTSYPLALEGALKLKEISYIHAEGYAAGEMKHGPIALIDEHVPVVVIAPSDPLFEKTASNVQEVVARGGKAVVFSDAEGVKRLRDLALDAVALPAVDPFVAPILYALPVQLLAYHTAVAKGTDVDQPRNLAKAVTVE